MRTFFSQKFPSLKVFYACLSLLDKKDRILLLGALFLQLSLVFLDLIGVLLIGSIVAIATSAVQGRSFPDVIIALIDFVGLDGRTPQEAAQVFALIAVVALLGKSFLSYYLNYRNLKFLALREAKLATNMAELILSQPITVLQRHSTPEYLHSLSIGATSALTGVLGGLVTLSAELFLQMIMATTLLFVSPSLLIFLLGYFGALFLVLNFYLGKRAQEWAKLSTDLSIKGTTSVLDALGSYREIVVSGRRKYFLDKFRSTKFAVGEYSVKNSMLGQFSKYVFESSLVVGCALFAGYAFITRSALEAASLLAIFLAAAFRVGPSILRIQLGVLLIKGALGATSKFFEIYAQITKDIAKIDVGDNFQIDLEKGIFIKDLTFTYPLAEKPALTEVNCFMESNRVTALVGPSGSGKSTLVDLILGVLEIQKGSIEVFGIAPSSLLKSGIRIGYVPQSVYIKDATIRENICFGYEESEVDDKQISLVLRQALLADWIESLPAGVDTLVGERGSKLSGGQRQRIGIARALYAEPKLLVLDEATSALDSMSEYEITKTIGNLDKGITTVVIAHRLSTVLKADRLIYIEQGRVRAMGTFQELRKQVGDFDKQAQLMGINQ